MLKVPSKISVMLSTALSVVLFLVCVAGAFLLPTLCDMLINARDSISVRDDLVEGDRVTVLIIAYVILGILIFADILMFILLKNVRKSQVFTKGTVSLIRGVSWCCIALCAAFAALGYYFYLSFVVSFLAIFLGLCLRVVKNCFEEANELKAENDLTV